MGLNLDHFILKGDNNSWNDTYQPTQSEIVGKLWVHIPELGLAIEWAHVPINAALTFGLLGGFLMTTMLLTPSQNKRGKSRLWGGNMGGALEGALYLMGFLALAFLGLTIFAFARSRSRAPQMASNINRTVISIILHQGRLGFMIPIKSRPENRFSRN